MDVSLGEEPGATPITVETAENAAKCAVEHEKSHERG